MKKIMIVCSALLLVLTACGSTAKPEDVVLAQAEPWNTGDVTAALDLYTDEVVVTIEAALPAVPADQHSGKAEIRAWFEELATMNFEIQLEVLQVDGNTVTTKTQTWVDPTRELGVAPLVATEVYTVEDGKIKAWTWTLSDESLAKIQAAATASASAETWDLLYIQDSTGFGVPELYGERTERTLGVEVNVHNNSYGGLSAIRVLERIREEEYPGWADLVREAEIIVFFANPRGSGATSDFEICIFGSTLEREPPAHYTEEDWQPYRDVLDEVYAEIWKLRDGEPVVLRAVDLYNPAISDLRVAGIEPECTAAQEAFNRTIREAAEANGATLVSVYDLFNGPEHDEDPREKGYIGPDGKHTTDEGAAAIADALAAVGFEPTSR